MFCIPQEPFLFSGSLRENLDPLGEFREHEIWNALEKVNLCEAVKKIGGLDNTTLSAGLNFSVGEKQLICLARAILHNAKVSIVRNFCSAITFLCRRFYALMKRRQMLIEKPIDEFNRRYDLLLEKVLLLQLLIEYKPFWIVIEF